MEPEHAVIGTTIHNSTPHWLSPAKATPGSPNVLVVLFDDVGFADFGCYGSEIDTPTIDAIAATGLRYTGFHTTAMCSTTRAAMLTGRNHHHVGVGCLANFDSGYPGYRGKITRSAGTIAEILRSEGYRNYMLGKWHVTPLTESGPTGPFDGWPLSRGFDRFYGFLDAETDQYSPELVRDNTHIEAPGNYETGYHLTSDLADNAVKMLKDHQAGAPDDPWLLWFAPGACHAPHQAPKELIDHYAAIFAKGWDQTRDDRLAQQIERGIVPPETMLPPRNDWVKPWAEHTGDEQRVFARLAGAYAAMLDHADQQLAKIVQFVAESGQLDNTLILVLSDNGASQEGGPLGFVNALGPFNLMPEPMAAKLERIEDIGGPDTHSNFPWGFAMASNTPLKRYKQNTHGGGIRDPLVISWPHRIADAGGLRDQFCHVTDLAPTIFDALGIVPPATLGGEPQLAFDGASFAATFDNATAPPPKDTQYFEMFGHRGLWHDGYKAVAFHPPGTAFDDDVWELYNLAADFSENNDLAASEPERLAALQELWWQEAARNNVLPLDDRFGERFAENAERHRGDRTRYTFWHGMGHIPSDVAPDLRSRSYRITATVKIPTTGAEGVLVAHGDATSGYSLFVRNNRLVHDLNIGGNHHIIESDREVPTGPCELSFEMRRHASEPAEPNHGIGTLFINGEAAGSFETTNIFWILISWSGLDIGLDRGTTVLDYAGDGRYLGPFEFTGHLEKVVIDLALDQQLDHDRSGDAELSRE